MPTTQSPLRKPRLSSIQSGRSRSVPMYVTGMTTPLPSRRQASWAHSPALSGSMPTGRCGPWYSSGADREEHERAARQLVPQLCGAQHLEPDLTLFHRHSPFRRTIAPSRPGG